MKAKEATSSVQSQFQIVSINDTTVAFRNVLGQFLAAVDDNTLMWDRDSIGAWEEYTMEQHGTKSAFKTFHNDYLSVTEDGAFLRGISAVGPQEHGLFEIEDMCKTGNSLAYSKLIFMLNQIKL